MVLMRTEEKWQMKTRGSLLMMRSSVCLLSFLIGTSRFGSLYAPFGAYRDHFHVAYEIKFEVRHCIYYFLLKLSGLTVKMEKKKKSQKR